MPDITFVDTDDNVIGSGTKKEAWEKGTIHRIVRIFVFNSKGEILIQKRVRRYEKDAILRMLKKKL